MDQNLLLPLAGLFVIGYFLFEALKNTGLSDAIQQEKGTGDGTGAIMQYQELSDIAVSPQHTQIRKDYTPTIRTEEGPYGVPRVVHKAPGSWFIEGGDFFNKFW